MDYLSIARKAESEFRQTHRGAPQVEQSVISDITEGRTVAVKICSHVLDACIWLALDEHFKADDGLVVFYASEIPLLRGKSEETLRKIYEARLVFSGGKVVRPEEMQ